MEEHKDIDQVRTLVEELNRLKSAATLLEQSQNSIDKAASERTELFNQINLQLSEHSNELVSLNQNIGGLRSILEAKALPDDLNRLETQVQEIKEAAGDLGTEMQALKVENGVNSTAIQTIFSELDILKKHINSEIDISITSFQNRILLLEQKDVLLKEKISDLRHDLNARASAIDTILENLSNPSIDVNRLEEKEWNTLFLKELEPIKAQQAVAQKDYKSLYHEYVYLHEQFKIIGELQTIQLKEKIEDLEKNFSNFQMQVAQVPENLISKLIDLQYENAAIRKRLYVFGLILVAIPALVFLIVVLYLFIRTIL